MEIIDILNKLSTARMEYQTEDQSVYNKFVVPYFIDKCDLRALSHSIALVGSRGSGKSTYIRYFSHSTRFDSKLDSVPEAEFDCIVLYWKPDTAYCQGLKPGWLGEAATQFFMAHASLALIDEIGAMLQNVTHHFSDVLLDLETGKRFFSCVSTVTSHSITDLGELREWVSDKRYELSTRLNPVNTDSLISIEPRAMMDYLIGALRKDCSKFKHTIIKIFVDEFELLTCQQQKIINTYRKESHRNLNWNVAYKANASPTRETTSNQHLQLPDDFREENIDSLIDTEYETYAAEIFLLTLQNAGLSSQELEFEPAFLGERINLEKRTDNNYKKKVAHLVNSILPTPSISELSAIFLESNAAYNKVEDALSIHSIPKETVSIILKNPSLAITFLGTHKQKNFDPKLFIKFTQEEKSAKSKVADKIGSYEYNTLLSLNLQNASIQIPTYAGFSRYITMTRPNVRHFKDLCFSALRQFSEKGVSSDINSLEDIPPIPFECMHLGAISTSVTLTKEVASYPPFGNKLSQMLNRIGELFKISQKSSYQSEPERVIFSLHYDFSGEDPELECFFESAKCWRVLISDDSRRIKDDMNMTSQEFQLNPIYSPRFGISFRKKRGIVFSVDQFKSLISGDNDQFTTLKKNYQKKWKIDEEEVKQGLLL